MYVYIYISIYIYIWLVVSTPLKNISQLGLFFPIYGKITNVPNHQPDMTKRIYVYRKGFFIVPILPFFVFLPPNGPMAPWPHGTSTSQATTLGDCGGGRERRTAQREAVGFFSVLLRAGDVGWFINQR